MGLFSNDNSFDLYNDAVNKNAALYNGIALPQYQQYNPELYNDQSADYQTTQADPLIKNAQMQALSKMAGLADSGLSDQDRAGYQQAEDQGNQMAKSGTDAAINNAASRGVAGSGLEFAMREMANQGGAQRTQQSALQQASDAAKQRAMYQQAYGNQLSTARNQDFSENQANTDIINKFNMANTQQRNATNNANVDQQNGAFKYNQGLLDKNYQNQLGRADRISGFNNQAANIGAAQNAQDKKRAGAIGGLIGAGIGGAAGGWQGAGVGSQVGQTVGGF